MVRKSRGWYYLALILLSGLVSVYAQRRDLVTLYHSYRQSEESLRAIEVRLTTRQNEEEVLRTRVDHLDSDPLEVEAAIRRGKGLVREGETVYRVDLPGEAPR